VSKNPTLEESFPTVQRALTEQKTVLIVGNCRVNYEGRASSMLDWGERIIIIKADGSVLVHRPVGFEPVNWQSSGCILTVEHTGEELKIKAVRLQPHELIKIFLNKIYSLTVIDLKDAGEFDLHVSELEIKKAILTNPRLIEDGFRPISDEKNLEEAGFIDIFGEDVNGNFVVIEIKRIPASKEAAFQLKRYIDSIKRKINRSIRGIIVAPDLKKDVQPLLASLGLEYKCISLRQCFQVLKKEKLKKISDYFNHQEIR
jgi:RecB family endonuclease NucS